MKFTDILKALRNAWAFAWPPVVAVALILLITDYVSSFSFKEWVLGGVEFIRKKLGWLHEVRELLGEHGLEKLLQVFAGVLVVVVLYLIKHVVLKVAGLLPPYLQTSMSVLLLKLLPEKEIVRLFRRYPDAKNFDDACQWAEVDHSLSQPLADPQSVGTGIAQLAKLGALVAVIVTFANLRSPEGDPAIPRMLAVIGICALAGIGTTIATLKETEAGVRKRWCSYRNSLLPATADLKNEDVSAEEFQRVKDEVAAAKTQRWWRIRFFDKRAAEWFKAHVLKH